METVQKDTFGCALELKSVDERPDSLDGRSTGEPRMSTREMNNQITPLFAVKIREAVHGVASVLQTVFALTQKVSHTALLVENQRIFE